MCVQYENQMSEQNYPYQENTKAVHLHYNRKQIPPLGLFSINFTKTQNVLLKRSWKGENH